LTSPKSYKNPKVDHEGLLIIFNIAPLVRKGQWGIFICTTGTWIFAQIFNNYYYIFMAKYLVVSGKICIFATCKKGL